MRIFAIVKKAVIMQVRDLWALLLTLIAAPFFILVYYAMTSGGSTTYNVLLDYADRGGTMIIKRELVSALKAVTYNNGPSALTLREITDTAQAKKEISDRKADVLLIIPEGFSDSLEIGSTPQFIVYGEASNPKYSIGLIFSITGIESFIKKHTAVKPMYTFKERFMGNSEAKSEFDVYAPGILVFSMIMLILSCSLSIIRDVEDNTMVRLKLSRMTVFDYLAGNTLVQWMVGLISFALTLWLAMLLGFKSMGSMWVVLLVCSLTILSIIAISLILVAFCRNASMVMIIGNFPLFILMFFSGSMLPLPRHEIYSGFAISDLLPPTHAVNAMNKVFTFGMGLRDIKHELAMLSFLTVIYFITGVILFKKRHISTA